MAGIGGSRVVPGSPRAVLTALQELLHSDNRFVVARDETLTVVQPHGRTRAAVITLMTGEDRSVARAGDSTRVGWTLHGVGGRDQLSFVGLIDSWLDRAGAGQLAARRPERELNP